MGDLGYDYSGCQVLVLGGTRGAGLAAARIFREYGADVTVTGTRKAPSAYQANLSGFTYRQLDLCDPDQIRDYVSTVEALDILVSAAGCRLPLGVSVGDREFIVQAVRLSLAGPIHLAAKLRPKLSSSAIRGGGSVIALPAARAWSELILDPTPTEYATQVQRFGTQWARHGVRFNALIAFPSIPTQHGNSTNHANAPAVARSASGSNMTAATGHSALPQLSVPDVRTDVEQELASLTVFLASAGAAGLSGQTLAVHGSLRG